MEPNALAVLRKVFSVYAAFWVVVIVGLYFAIGALMSKREKTLQKRHHGGH